MATNTRGVLFDVDGTLVDSTYLHAVSWWHAFRRAGLDVAMSRVHRAVGMGADQLVPHVLDDDVDDATVETLADGHDAVYATYWPNLRAFDGARDLLRHAHEAGPVTVLASSAGADEVSVVRRLLDADEWLDEVTSSADGEQSKPAPDLVRVAVDKVGLRPDQVVFVGDAVSDVAACARAGTPCVALECGGTSRAELAGAGAIAIYRDPRDLLTQWRDSPLSA